MQRGAWWTACLRHSLRNSVSQNIILFVATQEGGRGAG